MTSEYIPNTFQTPNAIVDKLMMHLTGNELKILLFTIRHIYGWQDRITSRKAHISITMFEKGYAGYTGVGISRPTIITTLAELSGYKVLVKVGKATQKGQIWSIGTSPDHEGLKSRSEAKSDGTKYKMEKARNAKTDKTDSPVVKGFNQERLKGLTSSGKTVLPNQTHSQTNIQNQTTLPEKKSGDEISQKLYENEDLILAMKQIWESLGKNGNTDFDLDSRGMFADNEWEFVIERAEQNYKDRTVIQRSNVMDESYRIEDIDGKATYRIPLDDVGIERAKEHHNARSTVQDLEPKPDRDDDLISDEAIPITPIKTIQLRGKITSIEHVKVSMPLDDAMIDIEAEQASQHQKDNAFDLSQVIPDLLDLHNGRCWDIAHMLSGKDTKKIKDLAQYFQGNNMVTPDELKGMVAMYKQEYPTMSILQSPDKIADWIGKYRAKQVSDVQNKIDIDATIAQVNKHNSQATQPLEHDDPISYEDES